MILPVTRQNIHQAAVIYSESWKESHKDLCSAEFLEAHTPERQKSYLEAEMEQGAQIYMLVDQRPVGIVSVQGCLIANLYVLPSEQNKGYGTRLLAFVVTSFLMSYTLCFKSKYLNLRQEKGSFKPQRSILKKALKICTPMGAQNVAMCSAQIASTLIVAPLGTIAIAAHSFAITAESLCYMPGYGLEAAATTLVGQCMGAQRKKLAKSFSNLTVAFGAIIMGIIAIVMFVISPFVFQILTPDVQTQQLATEVLRIELFAEPLYGVSIVASGALRGAGDTLIPSLLNLLSIWGVRLSLSVLFVQTMGLHGVWLAMCIELCVRGLLLLYRQQRGQWLEKSL